MSKMFLSLNGSFMSVVIAKRLSLELLRLCSSLHDAGGGNITGLLLCAPRLLGLPGVWLGLTLSSGITHDGWVYQVWISPIILLFACKLELCFVGLGYCQRKVLGGFCTMANKMKLRLLLSGLEFSDLKTYETSFHIRDSKICHDCNNAFVVGLAYVHMLDQNCVFTYRHYFLMYICTL
ncbi:hypothetical protein HAX54_051896 [Datura stramonium]|uniref:Uncharacterized protein n=1 Tax=Datura stramonium TaxID=4076 RepID=A0ABS8SZ56_DATST|nr:hypothetical protein [Datura stramonium]